MTSWIDFYRTTFWEKELLQLPRWQAFFWRHARIWALTIEGIEREKIFLRVHSLVYTTLLALIPLVALVAVAFNGFGGVSAVSGKLKSFLLNNLVPGTGKDVYGYINSMIANVNFASLGAFGILGTLYTVMSALQKIEDSFNQIMNAHAQRKLSHRIALYWSVLTLGPVLLALSLSLQGQLLNVVWVKRVMDISLISQVVLGVMPVLLTFLTFWLLYKFLPATQISALSALYGAVWAGGTWELLKRTYYVSMSGSFQVNKIYGTFAVLPLTLVWLQVTWIVVLLGAVMTYCHQHLEMMTRSKTRRELRPRDRRRLACYVMLSVTDRFLRGRLPMSLEAMAEQTGVTPETMNEVVRALEQKGFVASADEERCYLPARDPHEVRIVDVVQALDEHGAAMDRETMLHDEGERVQIDQLDALIDRALRQHHDLLKQKTFADLVDELPAEEGASSKDSGLETLELAGSEAPKGEA